MNTFDFFQDLMVMAAADGVLREEEIAFLSHRAKRWGITDEQFSEAIRFAVSPEAVISIPPTKGERHQLLREMIRMMAADGDLAEIEKNLFAVAAATMQVSDAELDEILNSVLPKKGE
jgi:uncharacterized tellurite resistance protein B-like protein